MSKRSSRYRASRKPRCSLSFVTLLGCLLLSIETAAAQERGWYLEAVGGLGWLADSDYSGTGGRAGDLTFDAGFSGGAAAGYDLGRLQLEGEYLYQTNDTDGFRGVGFAPGTEGGDFSAVLVAANAIAQFDVLPGQRASSYLGIGVVWVQEVDLDFETDVGERSFSGDGVGAQVFAGVEYRFGGHWTASAELRYLSVGSVDLDSEGAATGSLDANYDRTSLLFSIGYRF